MEYLVIEVVCQAFAIFFTYEIICQQCDPPCTAFSCSFHNIYRRVDGSRKDPLSDPFRLKQTSVAHHAVKFDILVLEQDIHACLQGTKRGVQIDSHEIRQIKSALR